MTVQQIIEYYNLKQTIAPEIAYTIQDSENLRKELVTYFQIHKNRAFSLALLLEFTMLRKSGKPLSGDTIMLGCYLLGLHGEIKDCLTIWNAKNCRF